MIYDLSASALRSVYNARISGPSTFEPIQDFFPSSNRYITAYKDIRTEALAIKSAPRFHDLMPEQASISANDGLDWRMFVLKAYGIEITENIARCPKLAALIQSTPEVLSAAISYLAPHKVIPPHRGPFKAILRFHLMLSMPLTEAGAPAAFLTVNGERHLMHEAEALLWDDTFEHAVNNDSDKERIALLLDVRRPSMPIDMRILTRLMIGLVQTAMRHRGVRL
jgi:aspartate beta-hydroxylase